LTSEDVNAMATYLRGVPAIRDDADQKPRSDWGSPSQEDASLRGVAGVTVSSVASSGAEIYSGHCASCHAADGGGVNDGYFPPLFHNSAVGARDPSNLVMAILHGVQRRGGDQQTFMAGFADYLSDAQVAMLATHLAKQYGDPRTTVDARFVAVQRQGGPPSALVTLLPWAVAGIALLVLLFLWMWMARRKSRTRNWQERRC
jgi:mono/diheme cytochrome c family protein